MIIKRPSIFIYCYNADVEILKNVCAGIEEEGVLYETSSKNYFDINELAFNAANDSMLGSGVGISGKTVAMQMKGIIKGKNVFKYEKSGGKEAVNLGANSARAIKKLPFREI